MAIQYSGATILNTTFTAANKGAMQATVISNLITAGWSQVTGPAGGNTQTVTISVASPAVITFPAAHNLSLNDPMVFTTTGALPTGLSVNVIYYVKTIPTSTTVTISSTVGGTVINTSGTQSGTQTATCACRMASATTPWGITTRIKLIDVGGNCLAFVLENSSSTLSGVIGGVNGGFLYPNTGGTTFRMIANPYQAFIFGPVITTARAFVAFGTPYIPTFLQGLITECGWLCCNSANDGDTTVRTSFRTSLFHTGNSANNTGINNNNIAEWANNSGNSYGSVHIVGVNNPGFNVSTQNGYHWHDGSAFMLEPLIAWGNTMSGSGLQAQSLIRGQLWDAVLIQQTFTGDTASSFGGHNWWCLTDSDTGDLASLWICTS